MQSLFDSIEQKLADDPCLRCGSMYVIYKMKIIPTGRSYHYPKFIPSVKEICGDCKQFRKFAKQENWLIDRVNEGIGEIEI